MPARGSGDDAERRAGRGAVGDPALQVVETDFGRGTGCKDHPHHVIDERMVHEHAARDLLQADQFVAAEDLLGFRCGDTHSVDDLPLFLDRRVVDEDLEQETVALRLGKGVDALVLDRVLGGHDEERVWHREGLPTDGHVPLGHHLEQCRLHLRGGAVDLVGEDEVRDDRAQFGIELFATLPVDPGATRSVGTRSGVNCTRENEPPTTLAKVSTARVLATPGTPSSNTWPLARTPTSIRSTSRSCPTMTRLTS